MSNPQSKSPLPVILSNPHSGFDVPPEVQEQLAIDKTAIYNECDLWAEQLYDFEHPDLQPFATEEHSLGTLATTKTNIARCLVDANRPLRMLGEPDGPVKSRTSYGKTTYKTPLSKETQQLLVERYWQPYHDKFTNSLYENAGKAKLMIDCHNMAQYGPSKYEDANLPRPYICIANLGDDNGEAVERFGFTLCEPEVARQACALANDIFADLYLLEPESDVRVPVACLNRPFWGSLILAGNKTEAARDEHYAQTGMNPPQGLMIEVNRGLYVGNQSNRTDIQPPNEERIAAIRQCLYRWTRAVTKLL